MNQFQTGTYSIHLYLLNTSPSQCTEDEWRLKMSAMIDRLLKHRQNIIYMFMSLYFTCWSIIFVLLFNQTGYADLSRRKQMATTACPTHALLIKTLTYTY